MYVKFVANLSNKLVKSILFTANALSEYFNVHTLTLILTGTGISKTQPTRTGFEIDYAETEAARSDQGALAPAAHLIQSGRAAAIR